jgi:hypothetical protein
MKKLQQFCVIATLTLTLTTSAFAGEMGCPGGGVGSSCVLSSQPAEIEDGAGDTQTPSAPDGTDDSFMEIALGMLLDVSSLL